MGVKHPTRAFLGCYDLVLLVLYTICHFIVESSTDNVECAKVNISPQR